MIGYGRLWSVMLKLYVRIQTTIETLTRANALADPELGISEPTDSKCAQRVTPALRRSDAGRPALRSRFNNTDSRRKPPPNQAGLH